MLTRDQQNQQIKNEHILLEAMRACVRNDFSGALLLIQTLDAPYQDLLDTYSQPTTAQQLQSTLDKLYTHLTGIPAPSLIETDDELRNINSFEYLRNLQPYIPASLINKPGFNKIQQHCSTNNKYDSDHVYGNYFTKFMLALDKEVKIARERINNYNKMQNQFTELTNKETELRKHAKENADLIRQIQWEKRRLTRKINSQKNPVKELKTLLLSLQDLQRAVYCNPNFALERSYAVIQKDLAKVRQTDENAVEDVVQKRLKRGGDHVKTRGNRKQNKITPRGAGSRTNRGLGNFGPNFQPMTTTSQPSELHLPYKSKKDPIQIRMGTQAQVIRYDVRINSIMEGWLTSQEDKTDDIHHIYFNNLSGTGGSIEKYRERLMTEELHNLDGRYTNSAVITLPSDEGLLDRHSCAKRDVTDKDSSAATDLFKKILAIANGSSTDPYAKDFYISTKVKNKLYGDGKSYTTDAENAKLTKLLNDSFKALGFNPGDRLSKADQQAVYFHFLKFELTNFILTKLGPKTFNFTCKDGIDRGGVSSAYYNLMKSIREAKPISKEEFETLLHGAPTLVKGRGMNKHTHLIWNAIDAYVEANKSDPNLPAWLPEWRNKHALPGTPHYYLNEMNEYIETRSKDERVYHGLGLFQGDYKSKGNKLNVAIRVRDTLQSSIDAAENTRKIARQDMGVNKIEFHSIANGKLKTLVNSIKKHDYINLTPLPKSRSPRLT